MAKSKTRRSRASVPDQFGNIWKQEMVTSVADTMRSYAWTTGYSIKDGLGMVIHKIEYKWFDTQLLNADADSLYMGLSSRDDTTSTQLIRNVLDSVIDSAQILHTEGAAAGSFERWDAQVVHDFTNEPGGGRLVAPKPLYFWIGSDGAGAVQWGMMRVIYTWISLSEQLYRELYESMNPSA